MTRVGDKKATNGNGDDEVRVNMFRPPLSILFFSFLFFRKTDCSYLAVSAATAEGRFERYPGGGAVRRLNMSAVSEFCPVDSARAHQMYSPAFPTSSSDT